ncbi:MAG: PilZ domain-containing protein [Candidatus Acidiferrales bacterium]
MGPSKKSSRSYDWAAERRVARYSSLRDLSVSYEGHSESIITRMPDVSARGMFINTAKHFPEGAVLNVRFRLARTGAEVQTRCEVRHCLDGVGIGVEFVDISAEAVRAIEEELHHVTPHITQGNASGRSHTKHGGAAKRSPHASKGNPKKGSSRAPTKKSRKRNRSGVRKK